MSILKAIKAWWKPEVKEASTKATVRFKNGVAIDVSFPKKCSYESVRRVGEYVDCNRFYPKIRSEGDV